MSNTINTRYRRKILMKEFRSSGGGSGNDCSRPDRGASKADLQEFHRERMKLRKSKRVFARATHRARPRNSFQERGDFVHRIWPKAKFAQPGRMA